MYKLALLLGVAIFLSGFTLAVDSVPAYAQSKQAKCEKVCRAYNGGDTRGQVYGRCMDKCLNK